MKYRPLSHTRTQIGWKVVVISAIVGVIGGGALLTLATLRARDRFESQGHFDRTITLEPQQSFDYHLASLIGGLYELDVSAHEGPVIMACGMLMNPEAQKIDPEDLQAILQNGVLVDPGKRHRLSGRYVRGKFYWTVINPSKDRRVDVTIKFGS